MGRGPARPIKISVDGPDRTHHIFNFSRPGPARPINFSKVSAQPGPARPIKFSKVSARYGPARQNFQIGPARPVPDKRPVTSPVFFTYFLFCAVWFHNRIRAGPAKKRIINLKALAPPLFSNQDLKIGSTDPDTLLNMQRKKCIKNLLFFFRLDLAEISAKTQKHQFFRFLTDFLTQNSYNS